MVEKSDGGSRAGFAWKPCAWLKQLRHLGNMFFSLTALLLSAKGLVFCDKCTDFSPLMSAMQVPDYRARVQQRVAMTKDGDYSRVERGERKLRLTARMWVTRQWLTLFDLIIK